MFKITEQFIQGKNPDSSLCEDRIAVTPYFAAVIDGATSDKPLPGMTEKTGLIAAKTVSEAVTRADKNEDSVNFLKNIDIALFNKLSQNIKLSKNNPEIGLFASITVYSDFYHEIWMYGDSQCLVNGKLYSCPTLIDEINAAARAEYLETQLISGKTVEELLLHDTGRELLLPLIKAAKSFVNNRSSVYGYPFLSGQGIWTEKIVRIKVSPGDEIVLASDGYPFLKGTLSESEEELSRLREEDPLCMRKYKSTKGFVAGNLSYDDRCYIRLIAE